MDRLGKAGIFLTSTFVMWERRVDSVQKMIGQLPRLSSDDRRKLRAALDFVDRRNPTGSAVKFEKSSDDWILPGIERELRRRGLFTGSLNRARLARLAPNYHQDAAEFCTRYRKKLNKIMPLKNVQLIALGHVFARALADYLRETLPAEVSVGPQTVLRNVSKIPDAIEASFPGYLQAGMVLLLINKPSN